MSQPSKKVKKRKDAYGNILWKGEYYSCSKDNYEYKYITPNGEAKSTTAKTLDELRSKEISIKNSENMILIHGTSEMTVNQLIDIYLDSKRKIEKTTLTGYRYNYEKYVKPNNFGQMQIKDVFKVHVSNFYNDLIEDNELSHSTIELINNFISPAFRLAVDSRWLNYNPCTLVMREVIETEQKEKWVFSRKQQRKFLEHTKKFYHGYYNMIYLCLYFGLRIGELLGMSIDQLDFSTKKYDLKRQVIYKKLYGEDKTRFMVHKPKTKNGIRFMYFYEEEAERCLKEQIEYARYIYDTVGNRSIDGYNNFIFLTGNGLPITPNSVNRLLDRIIDTYNKREEIMASTNGTEPDLLPHISAHNLRHTGLTRMAESGIAPQTLQFIAGHSSIDVTFQYYVKATNEQVEEDMKRYDAYLHRETS